MGIDIMMNWRVLGVAATVIIFVVVASLVLWLDLGPPEPEPDYGIEAYLGFRQNKTADGNWTLQITSGWHRLSDMRMMVVDPINGSTRLDVNVSDIQPGMNNTDAIFMNRNGNNNADAGDMIILNGTSPHIDKGDKVKFTKKDGKYVLGTVKELG